jgi:hypothetical protein
MSEMYFSGISTSKLAGALVDTDAPGMMSQLVYTPFLLEKCKNIPLVVDSGAYTKALTRADIEAYARLIILLGVRVIWYAAPDAMGDQARSNENYNYLLSLLPPELHDRVLWIYQSSAPIEYLYQGLEKHQRVGIGGLVPMIQADRVKAEKKIVELAEIVQQYRRKPHFFGLSVYKIIQRLHDILPDYTVDSTTWIDGGKYGIVINSIGQQKPANEGGYAFDTEAILRSNIRVMSKWMVAPSFAAGRPVKKSKYQQLDLMAALAGPEPETEEVA